MVKDRMIMPFLERLRGKLDSASALREVWVFDNIWLQSNWSLVRFFLKVPL